MISSLAVVEMRSLLARSRRGGPIDAATEARAFAHLEDDIHKGIHLLRPLEDAHALAADGAEIGMQVAYFGRRSRQVGGHEERQGVTDFPGAGRPAGSPATGQRPSPGSASPHPSAIFPRLPMSR